MRASPRRRGRCGTRAHRPERRVVRRCARGRPAFPAVRPPPGRLLGLPCHGIPRSETTRSPPPGRGTMRHRPWGWMRTRPREAPVVGSRSPRRPRTQWQPVLSRGFFAASRCAVSAGPAAGHRRATAAMSLRPPSTADSSGPHMARLGRSSGTIARLHDARSSSGPAGDIGAFARARARPCQRRGMFQRRVHDDVPARYHSRAVYIAPATYNGVKIRLLCFASHRGR